MLLAIDYIDLINIWNGFDFLKWVDGMAQLVYLLDMELMIMDKFMFWVVQMVIKLDIIMGECFNVWVYIYGLGYWEVLIVSWEVLKLFLVVEKFYIIVNLLSLEQMFYFYDQFDEVWQVKIYFDYGWGGYDGDIIDNFFKENLVKFRVMGEGLFWESMVFIVRYI